MDTSTNSSDDVLDYNDINFRLSIMYDYMYNRENISQYYEYATKPISEITIDDIKETNKTHQNYILKDKIKFIEKNHGRYIFVKRLKTYDAMIKIGIYDTTNTNNNDKYRGEVIDILFSYVLTDLIKNDNKFILMPLMYFDISYDELQKSNPEILEIIKKDNKNINENTIFFVYVMENYFRQITLKKFIYENIDKFQTMDWKLLLFKIIYALSKIINKYPAFRHNKLDLDSIYVSIYDTSYKNNIISTLKSTKYDLPQNNYNYDIKITNFYNSSIKDIIKNNDTKLTLENNYYDLHYILHNIYFTYKNNLPGLIINFIEDLIPITYRYDINNFNGLDEAVYKEEINYNPIYIITKNIFFSDFIKDYSMSKNNIKYFSEIAIFI